MGQPYLSPDNRGKVPRIFTLYSQPSRGIIKTDCEAQTSRRRLPNSRAAMRRRVAFLNHQKHVISKLLELGDLWRRVPQRPKNLVGIRCHNANLATRRGETGTHDQSLTRLT